MFYFVMFYTGNQADRVEKKSNMRPKRVYKAAYTSDSNIQTKILVQIAREHKYTCRTTRCTTYYLSCTDIYIYFYFDHLYNFPHIQ